MKVFAVLVSVLGAASAFAPVSNVKTINTQLASTIEDKSDALPFLPYPPNTKGLPGSVGFDPLRISDYFPIDYLVEAELKHSRLAMLAFLGFVSVDLGFKIYPLPEAYAGVSSIQAHDVAVETGAMGQIFLFVAIFEMISYISVSQMLQGSGRAPGDYGFDPLAFSKDKSPEEMFKLKTQEIKNGRLAMMAIGGILTQAVLNGKGFPYF
mmetsp:Transcript_37189/g.57120  ORF Transcript_37189/g.57120 Transcript_37189/m.57120 type:complete len:209 (+) Transcript_37189:84-710(+)